jgi:hypothetical protein
MLDGSKTTRSAKAFAEVAAVGELDLAAGIPVMRWMAVGRSRTRSSLT